MTDFTFGTARTGRAFFLGLVIIIFESTLFGQTVALEEKKDDSEITKKSYIHVPSFVITMYRRGRPRGNMTITLLIRLADSEKRATARKYMPRLNSAYVIEASRLSHDYFDITRPVNVAMLGDAFQLVTDKVLGHRQARVLISNVIVYKK